jgi:hypothetical protein
MIKTGVPLRQAPTPYLPTTTTMEIGGVIIPAKYHNFPNLANAYVSGVQVRRDPESAESKLLIERYRMMELGDAIQKLPEHLKPEKEAFFWGLERNSLILTTTATALVALSENEWARFQKVETYASEELSELLRTRSRARRLPNGEIKKRSEAIFALRFQGLSNREIAKKFGMGELSVAYCFRRYWQKGKMP